MVTVGRWTDEGKTKKQCPTAVGRPSWPWCPHTWLARLNAHRLEASGEYGGVRHVSVQALLLAPVDQDDHDEQQGQTEGHGHHAHVQRHVLGPAHGCKQRNY